MPLDFEASSIYLRDLKKIYVTRNYYSSSTKKNNILIIMDMFNFLHTFIYKNQNHSLCAICLLNIAE